jgi:hypothetical protein
VVEPTPTEREAVLLRWRTLHPESGNMQPSPEEAAVLLQEIRERAISIENVALELVKKQMRVRPSGQGGLPLKSFIFGVAVLFGLIVLVVAAYRLMGH